MSTNVGSIHYDLSLDTTKFDAAQAKVKSGLSNIGNSLSSVGADMMKVGGVMTGLSVGAVLLAKPFVQLAGDLQTTQQRMASLSGSTAQAKKIMGELYTYVLGKPIAFPDASKAASTLMGYGIASNKVVDAMKTLSAFSIVNGADMGQLALAYGQVNAKGKLMGQEIIQMTNNFVPVANVISKHFNVSIQDAMALMEGGKVSAEEFNKAMANFIPQSEIEKQANSFNNRMISLQGSIRSVGLALLGVRMDKEQGLIVEKGGLFDTLSNLLPKIASALKKVGDGFKALSPEIRQFLAVLALVAIVAGPVILALGAISAALGALAANPVMLAIIAIVAAIALLAAGLIYLQEKFNWVGQAMAFLQPYIAAVHQAFILFGQVFSAFVLPMIQMLWSYIQENLLPALQRLWNQISPILLPALKILGAVLGVLIIGSIMALVVAFQVLATVFTLVVNGITFGVSVIKAVFGTIFHAVTLPFRLAYAFITGGWDGVRNTFNSVNAWISRALGGVFNSITAPFRDAFNWVAGQINKLKGELSKLNPLQRHSPSLVDRISQGTTAVKRQYGDMFDYISAMASSSKHSLQSSLVGGIATSNTSNSTNTAIYGDINIASQQDADYFLNRLSRNQELEAMGLSPA